MSLYLPTYLAKSVIDINFNKLYDEGKRIILFDLDNTLISYEQKTCSSDLKLLSGILLSKGFKVYVLTNNYESRITNFKKSFQATDYGYKMYKPRTKRIMKYLEEKGITDYSKIIMIGDQLVTDILCANRLGVDSVLVKSISRKSEHFYTKINRMREKFIVNKIAKTNPDFANQIREIIKKD